MANEFFTNENTSVMQKLVQEVVNDPATYRGAKYLPSIAIPVNKIRTEVIEASGGLTNEHVRGTDTKYIQGIGSRVQEFAPGAYQEAIHYDESMILDLRELGQNDPSKRGIRQRLAKDADKLNRRIEARIELLRWNSIFTGAFTYLGRVFSYGIPAANRAVPLGALWSTDGINPNNAANPIADIRYWVTGGLSAWRKYKVKSLVMNGNTARWVLENANTKAYLASLGANPNISEWTIEKLMSFLVPGGPGVEVYNSWYQSESVDSTGRVTVGDAIYFIPDGYVFAEATLPDGDLIGEFVQTMHLASGTIDSPGFGKFIIPEENIAPGTKGGPQNPYMDLLGGVRGGVKLDRSFDVLTAKVIA